jgi:seryl-tRNA synthetase
LFASQTIWISKKFAVQVTRWVFCIMTGQVSIIREVIANHGPIKDDEDKEEFYSIENQMRGMRARYENELEKKNGIIKEKEDQNVSLRNELAAMRQEMAEQSERAEAQRQQMLAIVERGEAQRTEIQTQLGGVQEQLHEANDQLDDARHTIHQIHEDTVNRPNNRNKREMFIVMSLPGNPEYHVQIARPQRAGRTKAIKNITDRNDAAQILLEIDYQPNGRYLFDSVKAAMAEEIETHITKVRILDEDIDGFLARVRELHAAHLRN